MLKLINDLPANVLGVSAEGIITGTDYDTVLIPALKAKLKLNNKIRLLYFLGSQFKGLDVSAMRDDTHMGLKHLSAWEKIALVSDHQILNTFAKFFGDMLTCEIRIFKNSELEEAKKWIIE